MIEREFIAQKTKEYYLKKYVAGVLKNVGISEIKLKKIPLGEKIVIHTSRPSLVVGSKGANIKDLTRVLKKEFSLENPQVEINEVKNPYLNARLVAEKVASSLERFGSARFKSVGHKIIENVMNSGALGVELIVSGKIPGARAKRWRFYQGYLKKCGDVAISGVQHAQATALLKSGVLGIQVSLMAPDITLPDAIVVYAEAVLQEEAAPAESKEDVSTAQKAPKKKKSSSRKSSSAKNSSTKSSVGKGRTRSRKQEAGKKEGAQKETEAVSQEASSREAPLENKLPEEKGKLSEATET